MSPILDILNINLVDVTSGAIHNNVDLQIRDGTIENIIPSRIQDHQINEKNIPTLTGTGFWAIPGLIDCHVHLVEEHNQSLAVDYRVDEPVENSIQRAKRNISEALSVGVTTLRDVGSFEGRSKFIRDLIEKEIENFKIRLLSCGRHITVDGGHREITGVVWDKKTSLLEIVKNEIHNGADFIKIMNDDVIFDVKELSIIVHAAHQLNKKVACHAFTPAAISIAVNSNVDTIEHGYPDSESTAEIMADKGIFLCPTIVAAYDSVFDTTSQSIIMETFPDCTMEEYYYWYSQLRNLLPVALGHNVKIITGTDAGTPPTDFKSLPREISLLREIGATNYQALQAATINAAQALGISDVTGSLEKGKSADIVILEKNPLEDINDGLRSIKTVISRGYIVS